MTWFCGPNWLPGHRYICIRGALPSCGGGVEVRVVGAAAVGGLAADVVAAGAAAAVVVGLEVAGRLVEPVPPGEVVDHVAAVEQVRGRRVAVGLRVLGQVDREVEVERRRRRPGRWPKSAALLASWSMYAWALLPRVIVNSGPATPFVSCQPNGEAMPSAGLSISSRSQSFGLSVGNAKTR